MENVFLNPGTLEWLEYRRSHIGASDLASIMGISPWKSKYKLWCEKLGKIKEDEINMAMMQGAALENDARLRYNAITENHVIASVVVSDEWPVAMASLDGKTIDGDIICEIKCPSPNGKVYDMAVDGDVPDYYTCQIQWQLWVTKAQRCDYFVYLSDEKNVLIPVYPDEAYQQKLVTAAKEFWALVVSEEMPELVEKDYLCIEDEEANTLSVCLRELKEKEKEIKERIDSLEKSLLEYSDDGNCFFPKSNVYISKVTRKGNIDWEKVCAENLITEEDKEKHRKKSVTYTKFTIRD